jgi:hypothetical protein
VLDPNSGEMRNMKSPWQVLTIVFATALVAMSVGNLSAQGKDPLVGTWKLNVSKSTFAGPTPQSSTRVFEDLGGGVMYVKNDGLGTQGNRTGNRIVFKRDGKEYPIAALAQNAFVTIAFTVKSKKPFTADYVTKADGKVTSTATETLSPDGKTYTVTAKNTNPQGQTVTNVTVYDKQ